MKRIKNSALKVYYQYYSVKTPRGRGRIKSPAKRSFAIWFGRLVALVFLSINKPNQILVLAPLLCSLPPPRAPGNGGLRPVRHLPDVLKPPPFLLSSPTHHTPRPRLPRTPPPTHPCFSRPPARRTHLGALLPGSWGRWMRPRPRPRPRPRNQLARVLVALSGSRP